MAHFAKISEENQVLSIMALDDSDTQNEEGVETESVGQNFCQTHFSWPANLWIQCSYNTFEGVHRNSDTLEPSADQTKAFRGNYPQRGDTWDFENNIFIKDKPYPSWIKNVSKARWEAPIEEPALTTEQENQNNVKTHLWYYDWDETNQNWNLVDSLA